MKKILGIIFSLICISAFFAIRVSAFAEETESYTVSEVGGEFCLYSSDDLSTPIFKSESLGGITDYISARTSGASVYFASVASDSDFKISKGNFNFSGGIFFRGGASMTFEGCTVNLSDMNISFAEGKIKVNSGGVYFISGEILAPGGEAVSMDYSAGAYFYMSGGRIYAASNKGAVNISRGSAKICGGEIENTLGYAISNYSTLLLCGNPSLSGVEEEIFTTAPITLGEGNDGFIGSARVKYASAFEKGSSTEIFRCASESDIKGITLYDLNSVKCALTYMDERKIAAVNLPYCVRYYDKGQLIFTDYKLTGKIADKPSEPMRDGYGFVGWKDGRDGELYEFALGVTDDVNLYAVYELRPPSFNLSSMKFAYDGAMHFLSVEEVAHPLLNEGLIGFEWFKDGVSLSKFGSAVGVKSVSDGGIYKCRITFSVASDSVEFFTPEVSVEVTKSEVVLPTVPTLTYTGDALYPEIYSTGAYTVERYSVTDAGVYPVTVRLNDSENYKFKGVDSSVTSVNFEVKKAENYWRESLNISDVFEGQAVSPNAISAFGSARYVFSYTVDGSYTESAPTSSGDYYVKAIVDGCENFTSLESDAVKFSVLEERVLGIAVINAPKKLMYKAFEKFDPTGLTVGVSYNSGRQETLGASSLGYNYQSADSFRFSDSGVIISYLGASVLLRVDVSKTEYDISSIKFDDGLLVYDGTHKTLTYSGEMPVGIDGIPLSANISGGGVNVGRYTVTLDFSSGSENYFVPPSLKAIVEIIPREISPTWGERVFSYDGEPKIPSAYFIDVFGRQITLAVDGARSYAGAYVATAVLNDPNYKIIDSTVDFTIAKADYDMSALVWSGSSFVYDGEEKRVEIIGGLPSGVTVIGYANNKGILGGSYIATIAFKYDEKNYNPPKFDGYPWTVERAEYDLSGFSVLDNSAVYDGELHYPDIVGSIPSGIDGSSVEYKFALGVRDVKEGRVRVELIFTTDSQNYKAPEGVYAYVEILPIEISVIWSDFEFVYDGKSHIPIAKSDSCEIIVEGAESNAGTYTAYAITKDENYAVTNSSVAYTIHKAENAWTEELSVEDIYCERMPIPSAKALGGEVKFEFFSDAECTLPINNFSKSGVYYVVAVTDGDHNYLPLKSEAKSFRAIDILPVGICVELYKTDYRAFERVCDTDFGAFFKNNDGSVTKIDAKSVTVSYNKGDSLRYGDSQVVFSVGGFTDKVSVKVSKNQYDTSLCVWEELSHVYDGTAKHAVLVGLPSGVEIVEYIGNGAVKAGQYEITAVLSYDDENYLEPVIPSATLTVSKATVAIPTVDSLIYNGTALSPLLSISDLYSQIAPSDAVSAGEYILKLELYDADNYEFENGLDYAEIPFSILKRVLRVKISDFDLYLFEKKIIPVFEIVDGELCWGDELIASYRFEGDMIYASFENENYDVTVIPGRLNRIPRPSTGVIITLSVSLILLITALVSLLVICRKRRRIYAFYRTSILRASGKRLKGRARLLLESAKLEAPKSRSVSPLPEQRSVDAQRKKGYDSLSGFAIDAEYADAAISNDLAKNLLRREGEIVTGGWRRKIVNVDMLSRSFSPGDRIDINVLKERRLIPKDTAYIKVLARGFIDKPLTVYANDFSLGAVKMIALAGGKAIKSSTARKAKAQREEKNNESS